MTETAHAAAVAPVLEGRDLIAGVRDILVNNPDRHDQERWLGNYWLTPDEINCHRGQIPIDLIRQYADKPMNAEPSDMEAAWPMCGSTACACGWGAVLSAPPGSFIDGATIVFPDGTWQQMETWVGGRMGLTTDQAKYVFSPIRERLRLIRILDALIEDPETDPASVS
jgi:hypothetical protein